jgi:hypothetical protein
MEVGASGPLPLDFPLSLQPSHQRTDEPLLSLLPP